MRRQLFLLALLGVAVGSVPLASGSPTPATAPSGLSLGVGKRGDRSDDFDNESCDARAGGSSDSSDSEAGSVVMGVDGEPEPTPGHTHHGANADHNFDEFWDGVRTYEAWSKVRPNMEPGHTYFFTVVLPWELDSDMHFWEDSWRDDLNNLMGLHTYMITVKVFHRQSDGVPTQHLEAEARSWDAHPRISDFEKWLEDKDKLVAVFLGPHGRLWKLEYVTEQGLADSYEYVDYVKTHPYIWRDILDASNNFLVKHPYFNNKRNPTTAKAYSDHVLHAAIRSGNPMVKCGPTGIHHPGEG